MATRPWTAADDTILRALHEAGRSLHSIAAEMQRSKHTISTKAKALGLTWDRSSTAAATNAVVVDNKARRVAIVARMYTRMEKLQDRLEAPEFRTVLKGTYGIDERVTLDFVPTADERNIADTLSRYVASATKLEQVDAADKPSAVRDLLTGIADRLGLADGP